MVRNIEKRVSTGEFHYKDCAILYRTNAQSRMFEEKLLMASIPYRIIGGVNFYARKEIKDLLAYLKTVDNARDDLAVRRIINVPKRGIGATTLTRVQEYAGEHGIGFYEALKGASGIPSLGRSYMKVEPFVNFIQVLKSKAEHVSVKELLEEIIEETGYMRELRAEATDEALSRLENIDELISKVAAYEESTENPTLSGFLADVALVADIDSMDDSDDHVTLMTLHSAKGLEFPNVYMAGMEDGVFPSYMTVSSEDPTDLEEERRLCYVGITRAMKAADHDLCPSENGKGRDPVQPDVPFHQGDPGGVLKHRPAGEAEDGAQSADQAETGVPGCEKCFQEQGSGSETVQGGKSRQPGLRRGRHRETHQIWCGYRGIHH